MNRSGKRAISRVLFPIQLAIGVGIAAQTPRVYHLQGDYMFTHDPSIAKDGQTYYVFATGKAPGGGQFPRALLCEDLEHWRMCGHVFDTIPQCGFARKESRHDRTVGPGCLPREHGEYRLYYAYSLFPEKTPLASRLATNEDARLQEPELQMGGSRPCVGVESC